MARITDLRVYKPNGEILSFQVGENTMEGAIDEITISDDGHQPCHPRVRYEIQRGRKYVVETRFVGFPYSYRSEKEN